MELIKVLVACGAELDGMGRYGRTAFHFGIKRLHWEAVQLLFHLRGNLGVPDNDEITPMDLHRKRRTGGLAG